MEYLANKTNGSQNIKQKKQQHKLKSQATPPAIKMPAKVGNDKQQQTIAREFEPVGGHFPVGGNYGATAKGNHNNA